MKHTTKGVVERSGHNVRATFFSGWIEIATDEIPPNGVDVTIEWETGPQTISKEDAINLCRNCGMWLDVEKFVPEAGIGLLVVMWC
jgi:hypothetical protein